MFKAKCLCFLKVKVKVKSLSGVPLFVTPWTVAYQVPPFMGFSRQECWSGLPFPSPEDLPDPGIEPGSPTLQADALPSEPPGKCFLKVPSFAFCPFFFETGCFACNVILVQVCLLCLLLLLLSDSDIMLTCAGLFSLIFILFYSLVILFFFPDSGCLKCSSGLLN